ncbi:MAG: Na/Pi cotransporter family protein [Erysipelotrichaceae bacterium]|nr:Na/Pi cotransporter family protein [Erysipelotrichaceae bacterium]
MDIYSVLQVLAGLAFFLYGMSVMSSSLEKMAGGALEQSMKKVTSNPLLSFLLGALITIAIQSSSGAMVMLIGLVNSGIIDFRQTVPIILGTNVGTTITGWILTLSGIDSAGFSIMSILSPDFLSPLMAFIGILLRMTAKKEKRKDLGTIFIGFSILMYGMSFMSGAMKSISTEPWFANVLTMFTNPLLAFVVSALFTALIQSSAATIGIIEAFALSGNMTFQAAIPLVLGANVGTCITGLISAIGASKNAKRVGVIQVLINALNGLLVLIAEMIIIAVGANGFLLKNVTGVQVALIHTVFNIFAAVMSFILSKQIINIARKIVKTEDSELPKILIDERLLSIPSVAVNECFGNTMVMAMLAQEVAVKSLDIFLDYDKETYERIHEAEKMIDWYEDELGSFLVKLSKIGLSEEAGESVNKMLHVLTDYERIGDHAVNIADNAKRNHEKGQKFSDAAVKEIRNLSVALKEILGYAVEAYNENDLALANKIEPLEEVIDGITDNMMNSHIERLVKGECTIEMGFSLSDLLNDCERISDHCSNVGVCVIEVDVDEFNTHRYLKKVKRESPEFKQQFEEFRERYVDPLYEK